MPQTINDLKPAPHNPREITPEAFRALGISLHEFGDISGIVFNSQTGHLVCGHQRLDSLNAQYGEKLKLEKDVIITPKGERFPVRIVDWPEMKEKAANLAANSSLLGGAFTDALKTIMGEIDPHLTELEPKWRLKKSRRNIAADAESDCQLTA